MEVAKISSKGQITIPVSVRNALKLKAGDKIVILEENGRFYFENSAMLAFKRAEEAFAGEAKKAGCSVELKAFCFYVMGQGLEKKSEDLQEEVAKQVDFGHGAYHRPLLFVEHAERVDDQHRLTDVEQDRAQRFGGIGGEHLYFA